MYILDLTNLIHLKLNNKFPFSRIIVSKLLSFTKYTMSQIKQIKLSHYSLLLIKFSLISYTPPQYRTAPVTVPPTAAIVPRK